MWQCPKCKQEFEKENQSHLCNETSKLINDYIDAQAEDVQPLLIRSEM